MSFYTKEFLTNSIRTIALVGHGGSGKTIFSEAALFATGVTTRQGTIEDGTTHSDYHPDEIQRKISINTSSLVTEVNGIKLNILDTPGYPDFTGEVKASLFVSDTACLFVKGFEGIEVSTELAWDYIQEYNLPTFFIISKINQDKCNIDEVVKSIKNRCTNDAILLTFPISSGQGCDSLVDVVSMKILKFNSNKNGSYVAEELPENLKEQVSKLHEELIEKIAESDEALLNKFFEEGTLHDDEITKGMREAIINRKLFPIYSTAANSNVGVLNIIRAITQYTPSPLDHAGMKATNMQTKEEVVIQPLDTKETALYIFKTISEAHVGELSFFKVCSGSATPGIDMINESNNKTERMGQIYILNGKERHEVHKLHAGDIGAVVKLKDTHTTNTLSTKSLPVIFPKIKFPDPVINLAIHPKTKGEEDKIGQGLHVLHEEDPTFLFKFDAETKETVISGQGELHLEISIRRLKAKYGVEVEISEPHVAYRETIKGRCEDVEYKHKKQTGGRGQYGHVHLSLEPKKRGDGFEFVDDIAGGVVPGRFIPAIEKGLHEAILTGVIAGYPVVDVKTILTDGSYHDVDSDDLSFRLAGLHAFKKGFKLSKPILLEPIYDIEVIIPEDYMGEVMGDLSSRRGKIIGVDSDGLHQIVKGQAPLKELYKYSTMLRSITQGRGLHRQKFSHYEEVPHEVATKIITEYDKNRQDGNL
ncbi:MAG: elongation factor G [Ignavibacteria bacterium]|nr:elongation factor G [Ignavibacteria bacterium]